MADKKKKIKGTSPKGSIMWFKLVKPDQKFKKYTVDLIVDDTPELRKIIDKMEETIAQTLEEAKAATEDVNKRKKLKLSDNKPIEPQCDAQGNETGKFIMKFRMKSEGINKDKQVYSINPPALFDASAKPIGADAKARLMVFNGSIAQIAFEMSPYVVKGEAGVTLRPTACMLIKIQQADADASQFGFSASELEQEEASEFESESESSSSDESQSNDDF